jgi:acyl carrier protein
VPHPASAGAAACGPGLPSLPSSKRRLQPPPLSAAPDRHARLVAASGIFEDVIGFDLSEVDEEANFMELGLDSLMLTQVACDSRSQFTVKLSFRQLMGTAAASIASPRCWMRSCQRSPAVCRLQSRTSATAAASALRISSRGPAGNLARQLLEQQMQLLQKQLASFTGSADAGATAVRPVPADDAAQRAHTAHDVKRRSVLSPRSILPET